MPHRPLTTSPDQRLTRAQRRARASFRNSPLELEGAFPEEYQKVNEAQQRYAARRNASRRIAFTNALEALADAARTLYGPDADLISLIGGYGSDAEGAFHKLIDLGVPLPVLEQGISDARRLLAGRGHAHPLSTDCLDIAKQYEAIAEDLHHLWLRAATEGLSIAIETFEDQASKTAGALRELAPALSGQHRSTYDAALQLVDLVESMTGRPRCVLVGRILKVDPANLSRERRRAKRRAAQERAEPEHRRQRARLLSDIALLPRSVLLRLSN